MCGYRHHVCAYAAYGKGISEVIAGFHNAILEKVVREGGQVDDCSKRQRRRTKRKRSRKWPRNRRVALITGSSWVIVYVTESNQRQIEFSVATMHQNTLPAT